MRLALAGALALLAAPGAANQPSAPAGTSAPLARITLTEGGIPHVRAETGYGMGYGSGYATALTDACGAAEAFLTYGGRRSSVLGPDGGTELHIPVPSTVANSLNDFNIAFSIGPAELKQARRRLSPALRSVIDGYVAGYNRRIAEAPPAACRDSAVPITADDVLRRSLAYAMTLGTRFFPRELHAAAPPGSDETAMIASALPPQPLPSVGSNGLAFGREVTAGGGLLLANPHYVWRGPERFIQMHLSGPGYDVMGAMMLGSPLVSIGHNSTLAWTYTVATGAKGLLHRLALDPKDPTRYLVDGVSKPMQRQRVTIPAQGADGKPIRLSHDFWTTEFGPIVEGPGLPWSRTEAFALFDPNTANAGSLQLSLDSGRARSVRELKLLLAGMGLPFLNALAADAGGEVLYANNSPAPALDGNRLGTCLVTGIPANAWPLTAVVDGAKSACRPQSVAGAAWPGILPAAAMPATIRADYVANSNDSHWLANPQAPLTGFSPLIGPEGTPQSARTRVGIAQIHERLAQGGPIDRDAVKAMLFADRNGMADSLRDDLVAVCRATPRAAGPDGTPLDLTKPCAVLAGWDGRDHVASVGAFLFRRWLERLTFAPGFWRVPFDPARPLTTPRGIAPTDNMALPALAAAVRAIEAEGLAIDAPLGAVQYVERAGARIALPGGPTPYTYNVMDMSATPGRGYVDPVLSGATYVAVIGFEGGQVRADAILASGQTSDPDSTLHTDGVRRFSTGSWQRLPFTAREIEAQAVGPVIELRR